MLRVTTNFLFLLLFVFDKFMTFILYSETQPGSYKKFSKIYDVSTQKHVVVVAVVVVV